MEGMTRPCEIRPEEEGGGVKRRILWRRKICNELAIERLEQPTRLSSMTVPSFPVKFLPFPVTRSNSSFKARAMALFGEWLPARSRLD